MNELPEIDCYSLQLLRIVAEYRSFTSAAKATGLSQSALSRQVQSIEAKLGIPLLERTTRKVEITEAGAVLLRETEAIPNLLSGALRRVKEDYLEAPRETRVGISNELSLAHIPGLFHQERTSKVVVSQSTEATLLEEVSVNALDLAIITKPKKIPDSVEIAQKITDEFCLLVPAECAIPGSQPSPLEFQKWANFQNWLLPPTDSASGMLIHQWSKKQKCAITPIMELENFDLMIQFVALAMGVAFVPRRALTTFPRKHQLKRLPPPTRMQRTLCILRPRFSKTPEHVETFLKGILFS